MASIYGQFAKHFSSAEEMEAYKKKIQATLPAQDTELDLQLFGSLYNILCFYVALVKLVGFPAPCILALESFRIL